MAGGDVMDQVAEVLSRVLNLQPRAIPSAAPGAGPEADRESNRRVLGASPIGSRIPRGGDDGGYGGHGDPVLLDGDTDAAVQNEISDHLRRARAAHLREPKPSGRIRLNKAFSIEGHTDQWFQAVSGPFSLFDGTVAAPNAGNSTQTVAITLPAGAVSPVVLLDRYPGALYMSLYVRSFSFVPTAALGTGLQECWFTDIGGAVTGLGIYSAASQTAGTLQSIGAMLTSPITDPGNAQLGTLTINNIGIGGTPASVRWQLCLGYVAMIPDPWFNEQVVIPPTPAEITEALNSMGAGGN